MTAPTFPCFDCGDPSTHILYQKVNDQFDEHALKAGSVAAVCKKHKAARIRKEPFLTNLKIDTLKSIPSSLAGKLSDSLRNSLQSRRSLRAANALAQQAESAPTTIEELMQPDGGLRETSLAQAEVSSTSLDTGERQERPLEFNATAAELARRNPSVADLTDYSRFRWSDPVAHFNHWQEWLDTRRKALSRQYAQKSLEGTEPPSPAGRRVGGRSGSQDTAVNVRQYDLKRIQDQLGIHYVDTRAVDEYNHPRFTINDEPVIGPKDPTRGEYGEPVERKLPSFRDFTSTGGDKNTDFENQPTPFTPSFFAPAEGDQLPIAAARTRNSISCGIEGCPDDATRLLHDNPRARIQNRTFTPLCKRHAEDELDSDPKRKIESIDDSMLAVMGDSFGAPADLRRGSTSHSVYPIAVKYHKDFGFGNPVAWHEGRAVHVAVIPVDETNKSFYWVPTNVEPKKPDGTRISADEMRALPTYRSKQEEEMRLKSRSADDIASSVLNTLNRIAVSKGRTSGIVEELTKRGAVTSPTTQALSSGRRTTRRTPTASDKGFDLVNPTGAS